MKPTSFIITIVSLLTLPLVGHTQASTEAKTTGQMEDVKVEVQKYPPIRINTAVGLSQFDTTGSNTGSSDNKMAGQLTIDVGDKGRVLETGLSYIQAGTDKLDASYIAVPLNAKIFTNGSQRGFYGKAGLLTAFLTSSNQESRMNKVDMIAQLGLGTTFRLNQKFDLLVEGSYNRGFLDSLNDEQNNYNQGLLILTGMTFRL